MPEMSTGRRERTDLKMTTTTETIGQNSGGDDGRGSSVAVIGAGLSGLVCARRLTDHGFRVRVFDKARGPGGRMSTRRADHLSFDHGAQYFTVRDARFADWLRVLRRDGLVAPWTGKIGALNRGAIKLEAAGPDRYVGVPGMNAVCRQLADGLDVSYGFPVSRIEREIERWRVIFEGDSEPKRFDAVVVSAPAPQCAALLADAAPALAARAAKVEMAPCWAVMAAFEQELDLGFEGAFVQGSPLSWVARNSSKPGRPGSETYVLHGSPEWSRDHLEIDAEDAGRQLIAAFAEAAGRRLPEPHHLVAHRWRFALPVEPLADACLYDGESAVVACGDWCGGPRVEGAFLSGRAASDRVLSLRLQADPSDPAGPR